ncbi:patatin-like phospholipase family protein [Rhodobacteraceae bacterium RKSG542]|uniref:patatin-like phospholipase family protein n=1 Tax=Pseudovibrio flavus TaxID=2529854 RepID=UPI0012BB4DD3|nr:patatin-like phospholipase family protein [Pseudovibrio flavus]MTI18311.1 patatin-like phospholipase family protein [Pseudovibrio flavus]
MAAKRVRKPKKISLALQGGGSHGAFTWGVLDWLLETEALEIDKISGTSAGAMNAAVLADGLVEGGPEGARKALERFWRSVSLLGQGSPFQRTPLDIYFDSWNLDHSPVYVSWDVTSRVLSPYQLNPLNINPLEELVRDQIDFGRVQTCQDLEVYVAATNVRTGKIKIFGREELTAEALLASACIPTIYQAVEIDGEAYWDGGYMGNPPLFPLFPKGGITDVVLIQVNPVKREELPTTAQEISERLNEITFNSTLLRELRAIAFVSRLIDEGRLSNNDYSQVHMHRIEASEDLIPFGASSKLNPQWAFLKRLFNIGRASAEKWAAEHFDAIGERSSLNLEKEIM